MEVTIHQDETQLHIKEKGAFITQMWRNSVSKELSFRQEGSREQYVLRSFTKETVPQTVRDHKQPTKTLNLQEVLFWVY